MTAILEQKYLTGVDHFDADHAVMIATIDELANSISADHVNILLEKLIGNWILHMMEEEAFMLKHRIPMIEHHISDHSKFLNLLKRMKWGLDDKTLVIDSHLINLLKDTALNHIQYEDVQYGEFYRNHVVNRKMPS